MQFANTPSKNATDIALVVDAMDLMHGGAINGFCIASSDSDYTRLAMRIREQGLFVMGIGRANTPESFVKACHTFVCTDGLTERKKSKSTAKELASAGQSKASGQASKCPDWSKITEAVENTKGADGWSRFTDVGKYVHDPATSVDLKPYGHSKLLRLFESNQELFEVKGKGTSLKVRVRE